MKEALCRASAIHKKKKDTEMTLSFDFLESLPNVTGIYITSQMLNNPNVRNRQGIRMVFDIIPMNKHI